MILRYVFALSVLCFLSSTSFAQRQDYPCGTETPEGFVPPHVQYPEEFAAFKKSWRPGGGQGEFRGQASGGCINDYPLAIYIIRRSNGTGGLTVPQLDAALAIVNQRYAAACTRFYYTTVNYIDNDTYYDFNSADEGALTAAHSQPNAVNVYFANSVGNGTDFYCGYAYYPNNSPANNYILMDNSCTLNGSTFAHEIGHSYNLPHTHQSGNELVNGSNCSTAGDRFCDTPADPVLSGKVNNSCNYTGTDVDANGDAYVPDTRNLMSYSRKFCRDFFSGEQLATIAFTSEFYSDRNNLFDPVLHVDFDLLSDPIVCGAPANFSLSSTSVGATSFDWDFNNDGNTNATTSAPTATLNAVGDYDVALEVSNGTQTIRRFKRNTLSVISPSPAPYSENLNGFTPATNATGYPNTWTAEPSNTTNDLRWNVTIGTTPSGDTGPDGGYTAGGTFGGTYVALEASFLSGSVPDATLITPCLDLTAPAGGPAPTLEFYYHMYGADIGSLHLDLDAGAGWITDVMTPIVGQQHSSSSAPYLLQSVDLSAYVGQVVTLRFRGTYGGGFRGDIAIDEVALVLGSAPLPVELLDFTIKDGSDGAHVLNWSTASEVGADHFLVQRAVDDGAFETLGKVDAAGDSHQKLDYGYVDDQPSGKVNYYRLQLADFDGTTEYSDVLAKAVASSDRAKELRVWPNPAGRRVQLDGIANNASIDLLDLTGRHVRSYPTAGASRIELDLLGLAAGTYVLRVRDGFSVQTERLQIR